MSVMVRIQFSTMPTPHTLGAIIAAATLDPTYEDMDTLHDDPASAQQAIADAAKRDESAGRIILAGSQDDPSAPFEPLWVAGAKLDTPPVPPELCGALNKNFEACVFTPHTEGPHSWQ